MRRRTIFGLLLAIFVVGAALQGMRMIWAVSDPLELDYGEGIILWQASRLFDLKAAFPPLEHYPHLVFHYTPIYHAVVKLLTGTLGDPLFTGRLVSITAALWLVVLLAGIVLRATRGYASARVRWFGALLTCCCALQLPTMQWVPLARVDMLGLALQFTAMSLIIVNGTRLRNQAPAFLLLLLGLYTKQSLLAIPAASVLLIGLIRPATALWLGCCLAASGLGILFILAKATNGLVIRHWILYNVNPFSIARGLAGELDASTNLTGLIAIGLAAVWLTLPAWPGTDWRSRWKAGAVRLAANPLRRAGVGFGLILVSGFILSWGIGKEGSNFNYCLDWQLSLCPLTGILTILFLRGKKTPNRGSEFLGPLLALLLGATGLQFGARAVLDSNRAIGFTGGARQTIALKRREHAALVRLIATFPGPVVSENMVALLQAGKPVPFEPAIIKQTTNTGIFNEEPLVEKTSAKFFDAFILRPEMYDLRFTPRMLEAIHRNYKLYPSGNSSYLIYVRQP